MNKMIFEIDYGKELVCATLKDEQELLAILSRATIYKHDWQAEALYKTDELPKIGFVNAEVLLDSEPDPVPTE